VDNITIRFTSKWPYNPASPVIARLAGWSQFSHCMAIINNKAYEATMMHGCRSVSVAEAMGGVSCYQDMYVPVDDIGACAKFGEDQVGKGYDFAGAFGIPFLMSEDWSDDSKWWCSEETFMLVAAGGTMMLDPSAWKRVRPIDLFNCNYKKSKVIINK
jgi:hypothetical protein